MSSEKKARPPPLTPTATFIYKTAPGTAVTVPSSIQKPPDIIIQPVSIQADIYLPTTVSIEKSKLLLFIHGGGWIHSNRKDYGSPLFIRLLSSGFVICSMDYRLCPETLFSGTCEDVKDIESWLKNDLQTALRKESHNVIIDAQSLVVVGASAGAHLALLTPKLWSTPPKAILSLYGPTDFHNIPYLNLGPRRPEVWNIPDETPSLLTQATNFSTPPTEFPMPTKESDYKVPRHYMGQHIYRGERLGDFLVKGLVRYTELIHGQPQEYLRLPRKGESSKEEIDDLSPLQLCTKYAYPPVYQMLGTADHLFKIDHMTKLKKAMKGVGQECVSVVVKDGVHGFDIYADDRLEKEILGPAVEWLVKKANGGS